MAASPSSVLTQGFGSWGDANLVVTLGFGISAVVPPPAPTTVQPTGGRGGIQEYRYPYEKWWKKQNARRLLAQIAATQKRIVKAEERLDAARRSAELARTLEAIAAAQQVIEQEIRRLEAERAKLAELEMSEVAMIWAMLDDTGALQ